MNKRVIIEGEKIHHVGYRPFLMAKARRLGIPNYESDNLEENGKQRVIISISGDEKQVENFVEFAKNVKKNHPPRAIVSRAWEVESPENVLPIDEYQKILDTEQHDTMIQAGLGMIKMQEETIGLQKHALDKQDQMLEKQDETIKVLGGKIDSVGNKVDALREETRQDFNRMDTKYDKMSEKMDKIDNTLQKLTDAILKLAEASAKSR